MSAAQGYKDGPDRPWTKEEDEQLTTLYLKDGLFVKNICPLLQRSFSSVSNRLRALDVAKGKRRKRWSAEEQKRMEELFRLGWSDEEIGRDLKRDPMAVKSRRGYTNYRWHKSTHWTDEEVATLRQMYEDGHTDATIATVLGVSVLRVRTKLKELGIYKARSYTSWTPEEKARLVSLLDSGMELREICKTLDRGMEGVIMICKQLRLQKKYPAIKHALREKWYITSNTFDRRVTFIYHNARSRAKKRGHVCTLTKEDIIQMYERQDGKCFYTGFKMSFLTNDPFIMSLERLDSDMGYTLENVVLTTWLANATKQEFDVEDWLETCSAITARATEIREAVARHRCQPQVAQEYLSSSSAPLDQAA